MTGISSVRWRQHVSVEGTVERLRVRTAEFNSAMLEFELADGDSSITVVMFGYRRIAGLNLGRRVRVEGTVVGWEKRLAILNPSYTLLAAET